MRSVRAFSFFDMLFPARCAGCGAAGEVLCYGCVASLGEPLNLFVGTLPCLAIGAYSGPVRSAVLKMKNGRRDVGERLGLLLAERARTYFYDESSCFVPVPTTPKRRKERGFDQSFLLARAAAKSLGRRVCELLEQTAGDAQRGRSRKERLAAVGRFTPLSPDVQSILRGASVILIDDVTTTGATLCDAAATLARNGADVRGAFVVAYAQK